MEEIKEQKTRSNAYEDFLGDISSQFSRKDEENQFLDSITAKLPEEDIQVNVGKRVKAARENRSLTLQDISQRTGMDVSLLEQIEDDTIAPPLGEIIKLAKALNMKMGYFVSGEENRPFTIVRSSDRKVISRYDSKKTSRYGYRFESLAPHKKDRHMEPFLVTLEPSNAEEKKSTHDGQEFIYVMEGTMEVRLEEETLLLEPGDSIYYDSTVPHLVTCHGDKKTKILAVLYAER